jgi:anti-sigma factor RsiW
MPDSGRLEQRLRRQLFRVNCPDTMDLGEYQLGMLSSARAAEVTQHLAGCAHCRGELAQLEASALPAAADARQPGPQERTGLRIAQLIAGWADVWSPGPAPLQAIPVGLRGGAPGPALYQVDDVQIALTVAAAEGSADRRVLSGLVVGLPAESAEARLWQDQALVAVAAVDELGQFELPELAPGRYDLVLAAAGQEVHVPQLEL